MGLLQLPSWPNHQTGPHSDRALQDPMEGHTHVMRPSGKLRRHTEQALVAAHLHAGVSNIERLNKEADGADMLPMSLQLAEPVAHPWGRSLERNA